MKLELARFGAALMVAAALMALAPLGPADAACLSAAEQRRAIASGQARPINIRAILQREGLRGEVVRGELCEGGRGLVWHISVLLENGKLVNRTVPAN